MNLETDRPVGVLIVDDQPPFRSVAGTVIRLTSGFEVVGEAESGEDALVKAKDLEPRMVLMDINLPGISGIEATRRIVADRPDTVVILLSSYDAASLPADATTCGAARYIHKEHFSPTLLRETWLESGEA